MNVRRKRTVSMYLSLSFLTCLVVFSVAVTLFSARDSFAAIRYVKPSGEAAIRRGQGNDYKIMAMVKDGTSVELIEENDSYSLVRLTNGIEGWILRRFLSVEAPLDDVVAALRKETEELQQREVEATQKAEELSAVLSRTKTDLDALVMERDKVIADYQKLQRDTADVIKIKNDLEQTTAENSRLIETMTSIEEENTTLKKDKAVNWFLSGAGVLLAGMLLGRMPSPSRKRKSSLLS